MLERIKSPVDVKELSNRELEILSDDLRRRIIEVTSRVGGHLAPSLGTVDLTIALLKIFDPLANRIVWDVGHQSYAYKILTGRNERFDTLRQLGGISGFNNIFESDYDAFGVGHSSTSISAALGISCANELKNDKNKTIAIIGDGALTGGMSFEALNHAGHLKKELIVILNDNTMSISKNVGGLQNYLTNMLVSKPYNSLKKQVWELSNNLPEYIRSKFVYGVQKMEESLINILVPNIIFEDLGFKYVGPVDGHNISRLAKIFYKINKNMTGPVLVHVITQKGKGYNYAEADSTKFHGVGPYCEKTGKTKTKSQETYSSLLGKHLCKMAKANEEVIAITAAMSEGTGLSCFEKTYPDRFFDVGIAEQHAVTFAGGMAVRGFKPFVAIYSTFLQRALDQIIHDIALQKLPVVLCLDRAGLVGEDGATHHGCFDLSYLNFIPNMTVMAPACGAEFCLMLDFAEKYTKGPIAIRYPRGMVATELTDTPDIELGKAQTILEGEKIAVLSIGNALNEAEELCHLLKKANYNPTLLNMRFLKPLDYKALKKLVDNSEIIITLEENSLIGGFSSLIKSFYCNETVSVYSFGISDQFVTHGSTSSLKELIGFTPMQIYDRLLIDKVIRNYD